MSLFWKTLSNGSNFPISKFMNKSSFIQFLENKLFGKMVFRGFSQRKDTKIEFPREVVIVGGQRTPFGRFQGQLRSLNACELGSIAIRAALEKSKVLINDIDEVYMGNVLSAGVGQSPARQAALKAGLPTSAICTTVNKVCSSGLKSVMLGAQSIALGMSDVVVTGGMESMSHAPFLLSRSATLSKLGNLNLTDSLLNDGLLDAKEGLHMGDIAEICAEEMKISRESQDDRAILSYQRALNAQATGILSMEITPVEIPVNGKSGEMKTIKTDEECSRFDPVKLRDLPPCFKEGGTVTAGNASPVSDGAVSIVLTSVDYAKRHGLNVWARIEAFADAEQAPERFPTSSSLAILRALKFSGLNLADIKLFEFNEAFSVVTLANERLLGLSNEVVNVHGGAVSLGHPIGASGARVLLTLINGMALRGEDVGIAAICNGGGGATAMVIRRDPSYVLHEHATHSSHKG